MIVAYFGYKNDPCEVSSLRGLESMCQVWYTCDKTRCGEDRAIGEYRAIDEQMAVCTPLSVAHAQRTC